MLPALCLLPAEFFPTLMPKSKAYDELVLLTVHLLAGVDRLHCSSFVAKYKSPLSKGDV
jgi:hypothetical protein